MIPYHRAVVILAAGRGTRLNAREKPKVMLPVGGKPLVAHTVENLGLAGFAPAQICFVIGFQGSQLREFFGSDFLYAEQTELLGTAHAAYVGMRALPQEVKHVLVLGGDDGSFYEPGTLKEFMDEHEAQKATVSLLTAEVENPSHFGRVVEMPHGNLRIIEKEYTTHEQVKIRKVSTGTFCFEREWFEDLFPRLPQLKKLGEYVLPTAFALAQDQGKKVHITNLKDSSEWFGVNTLEDLQEADRRKKLKEANI